MSILLDGDLQAVIILLADIQAIGVYAFDGQNYTPAGCGNPDLPQT